MGAVQKDVERVADRMRCLCSRREYSSSDIFKKLCSALDGDKEKASSVLAELKKEKYVDDSRYAVAYARDKAMISGWGKTKIRYMLAGKGIDREIVDGALMEIDQDKAGPRLEKLLENKYKALKDDPQKKMKLLRFGLGRGYQYDEVVAVIDSLMTD